MRRGHTPACYFEIGAEDRALLEQLVVRAVADSGRPLSRAELLRHLIRTAAKSRQPLRVKRENR